jgi:hypothetical protein
VQVKTDASRRVFRERSIFIAVTTNPCNVFAAAKQYERGSCVSQSTKTG